MYADLMDVSVYWAYEMEIPIVWHYLHISVCSVYYVCTYDFHTDYDVITIIYGGFVEVILAWILSIFDFRNHDEFIIFFVILLRIYVWAGYIFVPVFHKAQYRPNRQTIERVESI